MSRLPEIQPRGEIDPDMLRAAARRAVVQWEPGAMAAGVVQPFAGRV
jgi:hypothetical protein